MNLSRNGTLALAVSAAALSFWLYIDVGRDTWDPVRAGTWPDLYVERPQWEFFDEQGRRIHQLWAERLEQWPGEADARLIQPRLRFRAHRERDWDLQAARGRISREGQPLSLEQQVLLRTSAGPKGTKITTERLSVSPDWGHVETDAPVVLRSGNWHFKADGLRADLGRQRVELVNRVRGTHE